MHISESNASILSDAPDSFPQRILVVLRESEGVEFEGDFHLEINRGGFVRLDLCWRSELGLERCVQALNEAYLVRYVIFNYGSDAPARMKVWAVSLLGAKAYLALRPAMLKSYRSSADSIGASDISVLLNSSYERRSPVSSLREIYPVVGGFGGLNLSTEQTARALSAALAGQDITESLASLIVSTEGSKGGGLEQWWKQLYSEFIHDDAGAFESMKVSKVWIRDMSEFSSSSSRKIENLSALWELREDPEAQSMIAARLELIRLRMNGVNPAYFNSARELGILYESILNSEEKAFIEAISRFRNDFETAEKLRVQVSDLVQ